ncbi:MAG: HAD family hydrolase [Ktedonobacteraceae bacterium]
MPIRAVIFDFGGVLNQREDQSLHRRWEERLGLLEGDLPKTVWGSELSALATIGQATASDVWQAIAARFGLSAAEIRELEHDFSVNDWIDVALVSFVRNLRPRYKTALLSNAWPDARELFTHTYGLSDAFDEMVISAEEAVAKPHARIFQIATTRLGIAPDETLFIDDWPPNVEGARAFGMQALVFISTEQALAELQQYL